MTTPQASEYQLDIHGQKTYISIISYSDRYFVTITQLETFGTMIQASADITPEGTLAYNIRTLIGKRDEDVLTLCARRLIDRIYTGSQSNSSSSSSSPGNSSPTTTKALILGIGLKPEYETLETIRTIINALDPLDHVWGKRLVASSSTVSGTDDTVEWSTSVPVRFPKLLSSTNGSRDDTSVQIPMVDDSIGTAAAIAAAERAAKVFAMGNGTQGGGPLNGIRSSGTVELDRELMEMTIQ